MGARVSQDRRQDAVHAGIARVAVEDERDELVVLRDLGSEAEWVEEERKIRRVAVAEGRRQGVEEFGDLVAGAEVSGTGGVPDFAESLSEEVEADVALLGGDGRYEGVVHAERSSVRRLSSTKIDSVGDAAVRRGSLPCALRSRRGPSHLHGALHLVKVPRSRADMATKTDAAASVPQDVRDWKHLEQLVTTLLAKLDPASAVRWDARLPRKRRTGTRQVDTVISGVVGTTPITVIVNSKLHRRPVNPNLVADLAVTMREVDAARGILVSTSGFSKKALETAEDNGVETYVMRPATDKDWAGLIRTASITGNLISNVIDEAVIKLEDGEERAVQAFAMWLVSDGPSGERRHFIDHIINGILARPDIKWLPGKRHEFLITEPIFYDLDGKRRRVTNLFFRAHPEVVHSLTFEVKALRTGSSCRSRPTGRKPNGYFSSSQRSTRPSRWRRGCARQFAVPSVPCTERLRSGSYSSGAD